MSRAVAFGILAVVLAVVTMAIAGGTHPAAALVPGVLTILCIIGAAVNWAAAARERTP